MEIGSTQTWIRTVEYRDATWGIVGSTLEYLDRTGFYDTDGLLVFPNDGWEYENWLNPKKAADAAGNPDNDALSNLTESQQETNPWRNDTDADTLSDGHEVTVSLTDPLDPADPGSAGGGTPPVGGPITTVTRFEAFRSRTTGTTSQANTQSSGHAGLLTLRGGAQQVASLPLVLGNSLQPETEPLKKSPQPTSEDELYLETRLVNLSYGPEGGDVLDQGGDGVVDGYWDELLDPTTGVLLQVWVSTGGGTTGPSGNNEPPEPTQFTGDASWSENGQISTTTSGNPASLSEAISFVGGTPISPGTDWKHESAVPAGSSVGASFTALKKSENPSQESRSSGQKLEVRLVRKEGQGSTHYLVVEKPIERTYLKITKWRNHPSNPEDEWTIAPGTEIVKFAINKDDAMSVTNRQTPVPAGFLQPPVSEGKEYMVVFLPVEIKVDYDRDGEDDILGDPGDTVPDGKFYRFWINDDNDEGDDAAASDEKIGNDSSDGRIDSLRDLEDFTRLHIDLSSFKQQIEDDDMRVGLKMRGSGKIAVYYAEDIEAGSEDYLFDESVAESYRFQDRAMTVDSGESWFPGWNAELGMDIKDHLNSDGHLHLIFEGIAEGEGEIVLIFDSIDPSSDDKFEGPSIPIKLLPVAKMFEHWTGSPTGEPSNSTVGDRDAIDAAINAIPPYPSKTADSGIFEPDGPEEDDVIVFVHGWRMEPWNQTSFGETSFKRLWHTGFKGKFFNFSWPTGYTATADFPGDGFDFPRDFDHYSDSEEIAYHVGAGPLKEFLDYLNSQYPGKVRLMSHSMGGIVSSEALRAGAQVHTYAACQTAMVAHAYKETLGNRPRFLPWETPERYAAYPPQGGPIYSGLKSRVFNFYNNLDYALDNWQTGQDLKPNETEGYSCHAFNAATNDGNFLFEGTYPPLIFPSDTYEIYAHATEGRSLALGAIDVDVMKGGFDLANGFNPSGGGNFTDDPVDHSGQFQGPLMMRWEFWWVLQETAFSITPSKTKP